jgi:putative Mn2+ efflux pump MntP
MLLNCILLALSVSIDSLGIGISYGIKHTKISKISNFTLFSISFLMTSFSIFIGNSISSLLSEKFSILIGSLLLIFLGIYGIYKNISNKTTNYDFNNSNEIDKKEAIFLGLALSIDSFCVGLGSGIIGFNDLYCLFLFLYSNYFLLIVVQILLIYYCQNLIFQTIYFLIYHLSLLFY